MVLALLAAVLCSLPANTHFAQARPIGWDDPTTKPGDSDGVVLKATSIQYSGRATMPTMTGSISNSTARVTSRNTDRHVWKGLQELFAAMRLESLRFFWVR
jgi:hypothetical protein